MTQFAFGRAESCFVLEHAVDVLDEIGVALSFVGIATAYCRERQSASPG